MIDKITKLVCWNCRGVSGRDTSARIKHMMKSINPIFFCIVETRANSARLDSFSAKLDRNWAWAAIEADGYSGGIIVTWQRDIGMVTPIVKSRYALHLVITNSKNESWILSTIYNPSRIQNQYSVWQELSDLASINLPWILIGDFNSIVSLNELRGGSHLYYRRKARVFSDFIIANNLLEVNFSGSKFTWCNNQAGIARKWALLDRCLLNPCCSALFETYFIKHLPRLFSDHAPLLLTLSPRIFNRKKIFRFDNFWLDYIDCHSAVRHAWNFLPHSNPMHAFSHLISRTRAKLISWKKIGLCPIDASINNLELEILEAEARDQLNGSIDNSSDNLYSLYNKLAALHRQNYSKWAQRARLLWVHCGDLNTNFFHNSIRIRNHHNSISLINDPNGVCFTDRMDIDKIFCDFFSNLWTDSSNNTIVDIFHALPNDLPLVSSVECESLIKEVTKVEVLHALQSLPSGKSPGPDGFNTEFYCFFWDVIGDSLFEAVSHFFKNSVIPNAWGRTFIALIPKVPTPKLVTDFRPISLCNVCYKIVSKILANRLKMILPRIIGRE